MLTTETIYAAEVGAELLGNGFEATACVDVAIGLSAFASPSETGFLDASFQLSVEVDLPGGLFIHSADAGRRRSGATSHASAWRSARSKRTASKSGPGRASTDPEAERRTPERQLLPSVRRRGLRRRRPDRHRFPEPLDISIPLIEVSAAMPERTLAPPKGIELFATRPSGADRRARPPSSIGGSVHEGGHPAVGHVRRGPVLIRGGAPRLDPDRHQRAGRPGHRERRLHRKRGRDAIRGFERFAVRATSATDRLVGGSCSDVIHGGLGSDQPFGGAGSDLCCVENAGDFVVEEEARPGPTARTRRSATGSVTPRWKSCRCMAI